MIDEALAKSLIFNGREERNLEYKRSMNWQENSTKIKIIKAAMAMANIPDGGYIVLGVDKNGEQYEPIGMSKEDVDSFKLDDVMTIVNNYADPFVEMSLHTFNIDSKDYLIIQVREFEQIPVVCKKDGEQLSRGDMFTRNRNKRETAKVSSQTEMREIIESAVDKQIRDLRKRGLIVLASTESSDEDDAAQFARQGDDL